MSDSEALVSLAGAGTDAARAGLGAAVTAAVVPAVSSAEAALQTRAPAPDAGPAASEAGPLIPLAKSPGVLPDDTVAEAGRKVLRFHLARMIAREPGTRLGQDPEELHGMRVATRRMRAAWRVFGDGFRANRTKRFRDRLRTVAGRLGAVRDRDVLIDALETYQAALPDHEARAIQPLIETWRRQRDEARELLLHELDSDAYRRWLDAYREFTLHEGLAAAPNSPTSPQRVRDVFPARLWQAYGQVRAYEPVLRWADVATLHELRIAAKRLRYTLEFVRETLGPEATALTGRIVVLQDHLGLLNDADVAATLARTFLVEHAGELDEIETQVIGRYLVTREQAVNHLRRTIGGPWRGVGGPGFRRTLGRLTARL